MHRWIAGLCLVAAAAAATPAAARSPAIKRTILQSTEVPGENRVIVLGLAEIPAGLAAGRHSHPGVETGYVIEGSASLEIDGEPARVLVAGDSYLIPAGRVHDARALGNATVKVLATYVVEKGKPLARPAP